MNDARITLAVIAAVTLLAALGRVDGDVALALLAGSVLKSPVPLVRRTIGR